MSDVTTTELTQVQRKEWRLQVSIVRKYKGHFWECIDAVAKIKNERLYIEEYQTFEIFVERELGGLSRQYVDKLCHAAVTRQRLGTVVPEETAAKFATPSALAAMSRVPNDRLAQVAELAIETAGEQATTSINVANAVKAVLGEPSKEETALQAKFREKVRAKNELKSVLKSIQERLTRDEALSIFVEVFGE